jgi:16S rRNA (guanine1207-N2)-methyltransferase
MTRWLDDPIAAADDLIDGLLEDLAITASSRVLIANQHGRLDGLLKQRGAEPTLWNRRIARNGDRATAWPAGGPFDRILLRLPKSKPEQDMTTHALAALLTPYGRLIVYGGNDEGIKPLSKRLEVLFQTVALRAARGHGRVLEASQLQDDATVKAALDDWRQVREMPIGGAKRPWTSYPGLFADGALDDGTALFLAHLPVIAETAAVLDYGCGTGVLAAAMLAHAPACRVALLDNDSLALAAARDNTGSADTILGVSLAALGTRRFDAIVSNPPIHVGVREDHTALERLIAEAPAHLADGGVLQMVVQRRIPLERLLAAEFAHAAIAADDGRFRIWRATGPRRRG